MNRQAAYKVYFLFQNNIQAFSLSPFEKSKATNRYYLNYFLSFLILTMQSKGHFLKKSSIVVEFFYFKKLAIKIH